ncbi:MAG: pyridoxal-phosphate dependent enzyme [Deltaproteobacteria bacterium]|nr:pyridoxal-phosphate dependent enzyme [Deltaproteobacteria bacterium]
MGPHFSAETISQARRVLDEVLEPTPLHFSRTFSEMAGCPVWLKPECFQKNGSQKIRGAYYMLSRFDQDQRRRGMCTFSSGNWAQGVAYAGARLDIPVTVIMPQKANPKKVAATRGYGGRVILFGSDSSQMLDRARQEAARQGALFVSPLGNPDMLIGLGTMGPEILDEEPQLEAIVVPVGGGGMIAGISSAVKQVRPEVKVYGVEPTGASAMRQSLQKGSLVELETVQTIADGLAVKRPDQKTLEIIRQNVDDVVTVSDEEIKEAIFLLLERAKLVVEPSGAVSLAAVLKRRLPGLAGKKTAVVLSGGNIDFNLLSQIIGAPG